MTPLVCVVHRLIDSPPADSGLESFVLWLADQKWARCPIVDLLDREKSQHSWPDDYATKRLHAAAFASCRYDKNWTLSLSHLSLDGALGRLESVLTELEAEAPSPRALGWQELRDLALRD